MLKEEIEVMEARVGFVCGRVLRDKKKLHSAGNSSPTCDRRFANSANQQNKQGPNFCWNYRLSPSYHKLMSRSGEPSIYRLFKNYSQREKINKIKP